MQKLEILQIHLLSSVLKYSIKFGVSHATMCLVTWCYGNCLEYAYPSLPDKYPVFCRRRPAPAGTSRLSYMPIPSIISWNLQFVAINGFHLFLYSISVYVPIYKKASYKGPTNHTRSTAYIQWSKSLRCLALNTFSTKHG